MKAFDDEVNYLRRLMHSNVVRLLAKVKMPKLTIEERKALEAVKKYTPAAFVTEYCERGSLHEVLHLRQAQTQAHTQIQAHAESKEIKESKDKDKDKDSVSLTDARKWSILLDLATALLYLHKQKIVHRDIKSANVLLTLTFQAKIGDFGLARTQKHTAGLLFVVFLSFSCFIVLFSFVFVLCRISIEEQIIGRRHNELHGTRAMQYGQQQSRRSSRHLWPGRSHHRYHHW